MILNLIEYLKYWDYCKIPHHLLDRRVVSVFLKIKISPKNKNFY